VKALGITADMITMTIPNPTIEHGGAEPSPSSNGGNGGAIGDTPQTTSTSLTGLGRLSDGGIAGIAIAGAAALVAAAVLTVKARQRMQLNLSKQPTVQPVHNHNSTSSLDPQDHGSSTHPHESITRDHPNVNRGDVSIDDTLEIPANDEDGMSGAGAMVGNNIDYTTDGSTKNNEPSRGNAAEFDADGISSALSSVHCIMSPTVRLQSPNMGGNNNVGQLSPVHEAAAELEGDPATHSDLVASLSPEPNVAPDSLATPAETLASVSAVQSPAAHGQEAETTRYLDEFSQPITIAL
jgi:hypothetical protein